MTATGSTTPNYAVPRHAATVLLLREGDAGVEILLTRRHENLAFMGGLWVFPGGTLSPADVSAASMSRIPERSREHCARLRDIHGRPLPLEQCVGLGIAACRETFEETGLLIGSRTTAAPKAPAGPWAEFAGQLVQPDLAKIHFIARAITPPRRPRRYDTRFFTADISAVAHRVEGVVGPEAELVEAQREMLLDPFDPEVIRDALSSGIDRKIVESAQKSPVYKYVKQWRMALPLHPEWRTLPMLFYIPPLLPVTATLNQQGCYEMETDFFSSLESARLPIRYMASLFSAGDEEEVIAVYRKLLGVRIYKRAQTVGDISMETARRALEEAHLTPEDVEEIYYLTALAGADERMVVPPFLREQVVELGIDTQAFQEERGAGFLYWPKRGL